MRWMKTWSTGMYVIVRYQEEVSGATRGDRQGRFMNQRSLQNELHIRVCACGSSSRELVYSWGCECVAVVREKLLQFLQIFVAAVLQ